MKLTALVYPLTVPFGGGVGGTVVPPVVPTRDDRILLAARDLLEATQQFPDGGVEIGTGPADYHFTSELSAYAMLWLDNWSEVDDAMSGDTADILHTANYNLMIAVRDDLPRNRIHRLNRLQSVAKNALSGVSIGGVTFPAFTVLRPGRRDPGSMPPEAAWLMPGQWAYIVDGFHAFDDEDIEF